MSEESVTKLQLAQEQLEMAIELFVSKRSRVSAITLAGAADGILHGLVLKAGKLPFSDYALAVREALEGQTPSKAKFAKHINDKLNINDLKHMDEAGADSVTFDEDMSALGAILKAIANHHELVPDHPPFINAMLQWTWMFYDGARITENEPFERPAGEKVLKAHQERPPKIVEMEKRFAAKVRQATKGSRSNGSSGS